MEVGRNSYTDVGFLVVRDPKDQEGLLRKQKVPVVVGSNFFEIMKEQVELDKENMDNGTTKDQFWSQILSLYETSVSTDDRVCFIKVPGTQLVKIPAYSMKVVNGTTRQNKNNPYTIAVQAIQGVNGQLPRNIVVIDTFAEVQNGLIPVSVVNLGHEDVWLEPRSRLGTAHIVDVLQFLVILMLQSKKYLFGWKECKLMCHVMDKNSSGMIYYLNLIWVMWNLHCLKNIKFKNYFMIIKIVFVKMMMI